MTFLAGKSLEGLIPDVFGKDTPVNIDGAAVELRIGREVFVTNQSTKKRLKEKETFWIPSGQSALILAEETIKIPVDKIAFIAIKFGLKKRGLINISGFHVDPGFEGKLKFSVYNAGTRDIQLSQGRPDFLIWFSTLDGSVTDPYDRKHKHQGQTEITDEEVTDLKGRISSPASLQAQIKEMKIRFGLVAVVLITLAAPFFLSFLVPWVKDQFVTSDSGDVKRVVILTSDSSIAAPMLIEGQVITADSVIFILRSLPLSQGDSSAVNAGVPDTNQPKLDNRKEKPAGP